MEEKAMLNGRVRDESLTEVTEALISFFSRQGDGDQNKGYKAVADFVGVNRQQLYYIISGRNEPTLKTVMLILKHYPEENELRRAMSLPLSTPPLPLSTTSVPVPSQREQQLDEELRLLRVKYDKLVHAVLLEKFGKELFD